MRVSVKGKLPLLLVGAVLLSMTWLGYWIGYMTYRSHINKLQEQLDGLLPAHTHESPTGASQIHGKAENNEEHSPLHRVRNFGETKGDNVYVIESNAKPNEAINRVDEVNSRKHAMGLHEGHANRISQHLNNIRDSESKFESAKRGRNAGPTGELGAIDQQIKSFRNRDKMTDIDAKSSLLSELKPNGPFRKQLPNQSNQNVIRNQAGSVLSHKNKKPHQEVVDQAAIDEFQELRKRLHANIHAEITTPKAVFREVFHEVDTFGKYYALIHSGEATRVHGELHANLRAIPDTVPTETYTFKAKDLPKNPRYRPSVANGHIGTAVHSPEVFMNGVYNGRGGESHRAIIPSTASFNITGTDPPSNFTRTYVLNTGDGVYSEETVSESYTLTQRIYAHRKFSRLLVVEVDLVRQSLRNPLKLMVKLNRWTASPDITFLGSQSGKPEVSYKFGQINSPETDTSTRSQVHIYYDHVPNELIPTKGALRTKWVFLSSIASTKVEALEAYEMGAKLVKSNDELYAEHVRAWGTVWSAGRVDVVGNLPLGQAIYGAYYYILSSVPLSEDPTSPFIGLSPSGLPFGDIGLDYQGHVFWDQETWMYPAILPMWPSLGRLLLGTRRRTMDAAATNAKLNKHQGLQFPWESALTGGEVCPKDIYSKKEIHISGDISLAILQYVYATNDTSIIKEDQRFGHMLTGIANFFVSVLKWNDTRSFYEIKDVVPPDEHHPNVNNSAYTNAIAKIALMAPEIVFRRANKTLDHFAHIAKDIYIPYSISKKYHPEFDGYVEGTTVKQADAILLGYPLNIDMDISARRNDLKKYEKATDISGPAMSWSMFTIGWLDVEDEARAESMFKRNFQYIKNEFQVWGEVLFGKGATNFITGMGGFLQSVLYGYGGLRFQADRLDLNPILPLDCTELHLSGVNYLGSSLNIFVQKDSIVVSLVARTEVAPSLVLWIYKTEEIHTLEMNHSVRIPRQRAAITTTTTSSNPA